MDREVWVAPVDWTQSTGVATPQEVFSVTATQNSLRPRHDFQETRQSGAPL